MIDRYKPKPYISLKHPDWSRAAAMYQINTRQFTAEGTLAAAQQQLPRLKALGVTIIWLMPIHEIGEKNRKGTLGSPYAVKDYYSVSAELGTLADLKAFVDAAHALGLYVILDWVANHTAWDNPLVTQHPQWYARDWAGNFRPTPWWDWTDIIDLDYAQRDLREYMTEALKYWVTEADIDGYRCDVAGYVPLDFWDNARAELDEIKPVFMLAEWEARDLHARAFDMSYGWQWYATMERLAKGETDVGALFQYYAENQGAFPIGGMRMLGVTNHDKNAWEGTEYEVFGDAVEAAVVLSVISEGMPLIYNGQEAGNPRRLAFFERDPIVWQPHPMGDLYRRLLALKKANSALWNGHWGAPMIQAVNSAPLAVFSFVRQNNTHKVFAVFNFSKQPQQAHFRQSLIDGRYRRFADGTVEVINGGLTLELEPWEYRLYVA